LDIEEDAFYTYEELLTLGWECYYPGGAPQFAYRLNRRLGRLKTLTAMALPSDKEAWQTLLVQFYCLCGRIARDQLKPDQAFGHYMTALTLATELGDDELICHAYLLLADQYEKQGNLTAATDAIMAAMERLKDQFTAITPIKGNVFLRAAVLKGQMAGSSQREQSEAKALVDKAANMLYTGRLENDSTFLKFNLAAVNHEKAKLLLQFAQQRRGADQAISAQEGEAIRTRLNAALDNIPADLTTWKIYFHLTEARMYLAQHDIEASACAAREALKTAKQAASECEINDVKDLYLSLKARSASNPFVDSLGVELDIF
jgi:hypothetical protein